MTKSATHAPRANRDKRITKTLNNVRKKTPFHRLPTAQKCCKKQYKIKIFVWGDEKVHSCPQANQNTKFAKQNQKKLK